MLHRYLLVPLIYSAVCFKSVDAQTSPGRNDTGKLNQFLGFRPLAPSPQNARRILSSFWSAWSGWSICVQGQQMRVRACQTIRGYRCYGQNRQTQSCGNRKKQAASRPSAGNSNQSVVYVDGRPEIAGPRFEPYDPWEEDRKIAMAQLYGHQRNPKRKPPSLAGREAKIQPARKTLPFNLDPAIEHPTFPPPKTSSRSEISDDSSPNNQTTIESTGRTPIVFPSSRKDRASRRLQFRRRLEARARQRVLKALAELKSKTTVEPVATTNQPPTTPKRRALEKKLETVSPVLRRFGQRAESSDPTREAQVEVGGQTFIVILPSDGNTKQGRNFLTAPAQPRYQPLVPPHQAPSYGAKAPPATAPRAPATPVRSQYRNPATSTYSRGPPAVVPNPPAARRPTAVAYPQSPAAVSYGKRPSPAKRPAVTYGANPPPPRTRPTYARPSPANGYQARPPTAVGPRSPAVQRKVPVQRRGYNPAPAPTAPPVVAQKRVGYPSVGYGARSAAPSAVPNSPATRQHQTSYQAPPVRPVVRTPTSYAAPATNRQVPRVKARPPVQRQYGGHAPAARKPYRSPARNTYQAPKPATYSAPATNTAKKPATYAQPVNNRRIVNKPVTYNTAPTNTHTVIKPQTYSAPALQHRTVKKPTSYPAPARVVATYPKPATNTHIANTQTSYNQPATNRVVQKLPKYAAPAAVPHHVKTPVAAAYAPATKPPVVPPKAYHPPAAVPKPPVLQAPTGYPAPGHHGGPPAANIGPPGTLIIHGVAHHHGTQPGHHHGPRVRTGPPTAVVAQPGGAAAPKAGPPTAVVSPPAALNSNAKIAEGVVGEPSLPTEQIGSVISGLPANPAPGVQTAIRSVMAPGSSVNRGKPPSASPNDLVSLDGNGQWSGWSLWSNCRCGRQSRTRTCDFANSLLNLGCIGISYEIRACEDISCFNPRQRVLKRKELPGTTSAPEIKLGVLKVSPAPEPPPNRTGSLGHRFEFAKTSSINLQPRPQSFRSFFGNRTPAEFIRELRSLTGLNATTKPPATGETVKPVSEKHMAAAPIFNPLNTVVSIKEEQSNSKISSSPAVGVKDDEDYEDFITHPVQLMRSAQATFRQNSELNASPEADEDTIIIPIGRKHLPANKPILTAQRSISTPKRKRHRFDLERYRTLVQWQNNKRRLR